MTIANTHEVGHDTVAGAALHERLHHIFRHPVRPARVGVVLTEKPLDVFAVLRQHFGERIRVDAFEHASGWGSCKRAVRSQLEVEPRCLQLAVHQPDHLQHQLVLSEIVAVLENDPVLVLEPIRLVHLGLRDVGQERHAKWHHRTLEDLSIFREEASSCDVWVHVEADSGAARGAKEDVVVRGQRRFEPVDFACASIASVLDVLRELGQELH
mmetsp:Transcript_48288/g.114023  ORF Transcript_48288/g.114023 Transcript_48288/m.114023 type:complete len:212 (-) Transcript_48288:1547-2182(-)